MESAEISSSVTSRARAIYTYGSSSTVLSISNLCIKPQKQAVHIGGGRAQAMQVALAACIDS